MKRFSRFLACLAMGVAAMGASVADASAAKGGPCVEDPSDCGFAPVISGVSAKAMNTTAGLMASINPGEQLTSYEVWLSYAPCQGGAGECSKPVQKEVVASGTIPFKKERRVKAKVKMLTPGCTYGYWFVASNGRGTVESEPEFFTARGGDPNTPKECAR